MNTTKQDQEAQLQTFFAGEEMKKINDFIMQTHRGITIRNREQDSFMLTTEEIETILHKHHPNLSATVAGAVIVIFYERPVKCQPISKK